MMAHPVRLAALLLGLANSHAVLAYVNHPPTIQPAQLTDQSDIEVLIEWGECDAVLSEDPHSVELDSDRIIVNALWVPGLSPPFCIVPDASAPFELGQFPAGQYTIEFHFSEYRGPPPMPPGPPVLWWSGDITVEPSGASAQPVPAAGPTSMALLATLVMIIGGLALFLRTRMGASRHSRSPQAARFLKLKQLDAHRALRAGTRRAPDRSAVAQRRTVLMPPGDARP